jgi:hypothetical protein
MLFINPMWDSEAQRIGKQLCTPLGYRLHIVSDLVGLVALLMFLGLLMQTAYHAVVGPFHARMLGLLLIPLGLGLLGSWLYRISWWMAHRKGFHCDYDSPEASWQEKGGQRIYRWNEEKRSESPEDRCGKE